MKNKLRIDLNKNTKLTYYLVNIFRLLTPDIFFRQKVKNLLEAENNLEKLRKRVNYYNKVENSFAITPQNITIKMFIKKEKKKTYYFDLLEHLRYFEKNLKISYVFGDVTEIPEEPSFVKSRPINGNNQNSILMKLNKVRHFIFVNDRVEFKDKKDILVWRGKCYTEKRQEFIQKFHNHPSCDIGQTNTKGDVKVAWQKEKMQLKEQLQYKFILAIEGNDVASNLKWVMSSNSLAFMVKPTYETWFMEGTLIPNYHYVLLKDDYSDLEEKIAYYSKHIEEALQIINNAHTYVKQFKDEKLEQTISLMVLEKYFKDSQQIS